MAIKFFRANWSRNIFWGFVVFYGITFVISSEGIDSFEYAKSLTEMHQRAMTFSEVIAKFYNEEGGSLDFIQPLLTFIVSLFTDNYHVLFGVFCLVFGFFYSRNIWFLLDGLKGQIRRETFFLIFVFAIIIPMWAVNGMRMWTAAHMFFYGAIPFLVYNQKKNLFWCLLSVFMHFSFLFPVAILGIYIILGNRIKLYFFLYVASFFINQLNLSSVSAMMQNYLPGIFQQKIEGYVNDDYASGYSDAVANNNFYVGLYEPLLYWAIAVLMVVIYFKGKPFFSANPPYYKLIGFSFLIYGIANLFSSIPSFGRFVLIADLFAMASIIYYLHYAVRLRLFYHILPFAYFGMLFFAVVSIRIGFDTIGLMTVIGNPVTACFKNTEAALIDLIK